MLERLKPKYPRGPGEWLGSGEEGSGEEGSGGGLERTEMPQDEAMKARAGQPYSWKQGRAQRADFGGAGVTKMPLGGAANQNGVEQLRIGRVELRQGLAGRGVVSRFRGGGSTEPDRVGRPG